LPDGRKTGYYYVTKKNPRSLNTADRKLEFRKYDPRVRQHVVFKEEKLKS
jgi:large subunit ribosomal protein L33